MDHLTDILLERLQGSAPVPLDDCADEVYKAARVQGIGNIRQVLGSSGNSSIRDWIWSLPEAEVSFVQGEPHVALKASRKKKRGRSNGEGGRRVSLPNAHEESPFSPKNAEQEQYEALLQATGGALILCFGASGTGKTFLAVTNALRWLKQEDDMVADKRITLTRPDIDASGRHIEDGESLCAPALEAIDFCEGKGRARPPALACSQCSTLQFETLRRRPPAGAAQRLMEAGKVQLKPLREIRGRTLRSNEFVIADEMQNASRELVKDLLKRPADKTKLVVTVATDGQLDRKAANWQQSENGVLKFLEGLGKKFELEGVAHVCSPPFSARFAAASNRRLMSRRSA